MWDCGATRSPAETLQEGSEAAQIDDRIAPVPERGEQVIVKKRASAFHGTYLAGYFTRPQHRHRDHDRRHDGRMRTPYG